MVVSLVGFRLAKYLFVSTYKFCYWFILNNTGVIKPELKVMIWNSFISCHISGGV